jgi:hypothetical protein
VLDRLAWALNTNRMNEEDLAVLEPAISRVLLSFADRNDKLNRRKRRM